jgi:UDP-N-acetylmuramate dehydrogenase
MVNLGQATSADVIGLIRHAQRCVRERFGHELEPEINFVGEF